MTAAKKKHLQLVQVEWIDAHSIDPWDDYPEGYLPVHVVTVGYVQTADEAELVLGEAVDGLVVMSSVCMKDEHCFGVTHIPRGCIQSIKVLNSMPESAV